MGARGFKMSEGVRIFFYLLSVCGRGGGGGWGVRFSTSPFRE